ncbi:hypothetical protein ANCCAN_22550 [Ancylostoma caninum]|uniref:Uncharacterized protein n=1 Tax=Ancylostoma caninum TaxID=29170 RepID=A0A368FLH1_ANCCA|nr:hypothetical protein ANCCAN_22550 [Ancylostoma caninum]
MKSTRETRATSQEKLLVYRFVRRVMEKGVRGLRTEFFSMKRSNNLALMQKFVRMNPKGKNRYKVGNDLNFWRSANRFTEDITGSEA